MACAVGERAGLLNPCRHQTGRAPGDSGRGVVEFLARRRAIPREYEIAVFARTRRLGEDTQVSLTACHQHEID